MRMRRKFSVKLCAWLGFQAAKEKSRLGGTFGKQKGTTQMPFIANTLKATCHDASRYLFIHCV